MQEVVVVARAKAKQGKEGVSRNPGAGGRKRFLREQGRALTGKGGGRPFAQARACGTAAALYVAAMYAASDAMRGVLNRLKDALGGWYAPSMTAAVAAFGICLIAAHRRSTPTWNRPRFAAFALVSAGYVAALSVLTVPEERFHLVQFGFLSWLVTEALRGGLAAWKRHVASFLIVSLAGIGDEIVQWLVPNRVGDVRDVWINLASAALAQGALWTLDGPGAPSKNVVK